MVRLRAAMLSGAIAVLLAAPTLADTSYRGGGTSNWFYNCANDQPMNVLIEHADRSTTEFSLRRGEVVREPVERGDWAAWRCGARASLGSQLRPIVKAR